MTTIGFDPLLSEEKAAAAGVKKVRRPTPAGSRAASVTQSISTGLTLPPVIYITLRLKVSLDELYAKADFITLHTPLNDATRNLICTATLAK